MSREVARILADIARDEMPAVDRSVISIVVRDETGAAVSVASLTFNHEWLDGKGSDFNELSPKL